MTTRTEAARLVDALAWVAEGAPEKMRAGHLVERAHALAAELKRGELRAGAGRVYLNDAWVKAEIAMELIGRGLVAEGEEMDSYAIGICIDSVLERLGLAVCPAPAPRVVEEVITRAEVA